MTRVLLHLAFALLFACGDTETVGQIEAPLDGGTPGPWTMHTIHHDGVLRGSDGVEITVQSGQLWVLSPWEQSNVLTVSKLQANGTWNTTQIALPSGFAPEGASFGDWDNDGALDVSTCGDASKKIRLYWGPTWSTSTEITAATNMQRWLQCSFSLYGVGGGVKRAILAGGRKTSDAPNASIGFFTTSGDPRVGSTWTYETVGAVGLAWTLEYNHNLGRMYVSDGGDITGLKGTRWLNKINGVWTNHTIAALGGSTGLVKMADFGSMTVVDGAFNATTGNHVFKRTATASDWLNWTSVELPTPTNVGNYQSSVRGQIVGDATEDIAMTFVHADGTLSGVVVFDGGAQTYIDVAGEPGVKYDNAELFDVDADGDLDIITSEHKANTAPANEQLGVIWYENPTI